MPGKMSQAHGSRRNYRSLSVGYYLVLDDSQTAVHLLLLSLDGNGRGGHQRSRQESTAGNVHSLCLISIGSSLSRVSRRSHLFGMHI